MSNPKDRITKHSDLVFSLILGRVEHSNVALAAAIFQTIRSEIFEASVGVGTARKKNLYQFHVDIQCICFI